MAANAPELRCQIERQYNTNPWNNSQESVLVITTEFGVSVRLSPGRGDALSSGGSILSACCATNSEPRNRSGVRRCRNCDAELQNGYNHWFSSTEDNRLRGFLEASAMVKLDPLMASMAVTEYLDVITRLLAMKPTTWPHDKCNFNLLTERPKAILSPAMKGKKKPTTPTVKVTQQQEKQRSSAPARANGTRSTKYVCAAHRSVDRPCCSEAKTIVSHRWRAPKKTNDRAWKAIAEGHILWEKPRPR